MACLRLLGIAVTGLFCLVFSCTPGKPLLWVSTIDSVFSMWLFPGDRQLQLDGCQHLGWWGGHAPWAKEPLMKLGAMDLIAKAVRSFPADKEVQGRCLGALGDLSLFNQVTSSYAGNELGAVELTVKAMRDHGLVMGGTLGCFNDFVPENRARLRKAGGVKLLLDFCGINGTHYWDHGAQLSVWCAFSSFHNADSYGDFLRHGGIESATAVMKDHAKSYRVREEVLQATKGICGQAKYRAAFQEAGFLEVLLQALREDHRDPQVTALGFDTLRMFIETDAATRAAVVRSGAVQLALQALRDHSGALVNTRSSNDAQHVYGDLNDKLYNVPGSASEVLSALALDGEAARREMLEAGIVDQLAISMAVTKGRVQQRRTWHGSCATLDILKQHAAKEANTAVAEKLSEVYNNARCEWVSGTRPPVMSNFVWEP